MDTLNDALDDKSGMLPESSMNRFFTYMMQIILQSLIMFEACIVCGADRNEKSSSRIAKFNGYRKRKLNILIGIMTLKIPRLLCKLNDQWHCYPFFPSWLERWQRTTGNIKNLVIEAIVSGISTNKVNDLLEALEIPGISKSHASRIYKTISDTVNQFVNRTINGYWPYIWIDVTYVKVCQDGETVRVGIFLAIGVNTNGQQHLLGMQVLPAETEQNWTIFLQGLVDRGLQGVKLVIADCHSSIKPAISTVLKAKYQRCCVHFMRNAYTHIDKKNRDRMIAELSFVFAQGNPTAVIGQYLSMVNRWRFEFPQFSKYLRSAMLDLFQYLEFPCEHWMSLYTTNPMESYNNTIKIRTDPVRNFPNIESIGRLVGANAIKKFENQKEKSYLPPDSFINLNESNLNQLSIFNQSSNIQENQLEYNVETINIFLNRSLEHYFKYLFVGAIYTEFENSKYIKDKVTFMAVGFNQYTEYEVLSLKTFDYESELHWIEFFSNLMKRGLYKVDLITSEANVHIKSAIAQTYNTSYQRCTLEFISTVGTYTNNKYRKNIYNELALIFQQDNFDEANQKYKLLADRFKDKNPELTGFLDNAKDDVLTFFKCPTEDRMLVCTTNPLVDLISKITTYQKCENIFDNEESFLQLVGSRILKQAEENKKNNTQINRTCYNQLSDPFKPKPVNKPEHVNKSKLKKSRKKITWIQESVFTINPDIFTDSVEQGFNTKFQEFINELKISYTTLYHKTMSNLSIQLETMMCSLLFGQWNHQKK
jgi:transposase-like protein